MIIVDAMALAEAIARLPDPATAVTRHAIQWVDSQAVTFERRYDGEVPRWALSVKDWRQ